jgi:hypothetical protein
MATARSNAARTNESGSVFVYVLVAVALFGALMFAFSRSAREGGSNMSDRQTQLAAADVTGFAQQLERAVSRIMQHDMSENQLSFDNSHVAGYANAGDCGADACKVFKPNGGGADWENPDPQALDSAGDWVITGGDAVPGVGDDATADLLLLLPGVKKELCVKINDNLKVTNPSGMPPVDADGIDQTLFTGAFPSPTTAVIADAAQLNGVHAGCFKDNASGKYVFFDVLIER